MASLARHRKQANSFIQTANMAEPSTSLKEASITSKDKRSTKRPILLSYDEIPEWHQDNGFIRNGYRPESNSTRACFDSLLYLHNETINIYSHLLPAISCLIAEGLVHHYLRASYPEATPGDRLIFIFFLLTGATCLGMSAIYHTLMNHSERISNLWLRLDFVGIVGLTLGDFVSGIYLVFYCERMLQHMYWTMVQRAYPRWTYQR